MQHVMLDLETFGTTPQCPVLSLGAVYFDPVTGNTGPSLYETIGFEDAFEGRYADPATIKWWLSQPDKAREALWNQEFPGTQDTLLGALQRFLTLDDVEVFVWGNGATFDISILEDLYRQNGMDIPWKFYNVRDVRTIVHLAKGIVDRDNYSFIGTKHNALDDAIHQVKYVSAMWRALRGKL